jgi:hypothetical protein
VIGHTSPPSANLVHGRLPQHDSAEFSFPPALSRNS